MDPALHSRTAGSHVEIQCRSMGQIAAKAQVELGFSGGTDERWKVVALELDVAA